MFRKKKIILSYWAPFLSGLSTLTALKPVYCLNNLYAELLLGGGTFASFYMGLAFITYNESLKEVYAIMKERIFQK